MSATVASLLWTLLGAAIGAVITFFVTRHMFQKQLEENPPVNEKMIRAMFMQMGRKPSEAQIRQVMKSMGVKEPSKAKDKKKKK
jgi:uncharacterized protein YneF (UPF0154 family)